MIGSLFSGVGGLERGLERATGQAVAWQCEYDKDASKVLAERWPGVPNLHDITVVDWTEVEPVEIVCGGFPCQPFSNAGQKRGTADERWMWPEFARCVRALRPRYVFVENVAALLADAGAFGAVLGDLAEAGYDARWTCLRAADIGAPHRRERLFLVATDASGTGRSEAASGAPRQEGRLGSRRGNHVAHGDDAADVDNGAGGESAAADAQYDGLDGQPLRRVARPCQDEGWVLQPEGRDTSSPADADRPGLEGRLAVRERLRECPTGTGGVVDWGAYEPAIRRWESVHGVAPVPVDDRGRLSPAFVEWMMGFPPSWVTDVPISRSAQLRCLGNAVVSQCGELAWRLLA